MAPSVMDHIHLDTDDPPTAEYPVSHGTLDLTPNVVVMTERSLTGKLHTHRLLDGADPQAFCTDRIRLKLTLAEMLVVKALAGKRVYYAANYHDDDEDGAGSLKSWAANSVYVIRAVAMLRPGAVTNIDPKGAFWYVNVEFVDDTIT